MSILGKMPVDFVQGTDITIITENNIIVKGPKGSLEKSFSGVKLEKKDNSIIVLPLDDSRLSKAMRGTARSIISNMIEGVNKGFEIIVNIVGNTYRASSNGKIISLFLGYSHPIKLFIPKDITLDVQRNIIKINSIDKELLGNFAAKIVAYRPVNIYSGKGLHISSHYVRRKKIKK